MDDLNRLLYRLIEDNNDVSAMKDLIRLLMRSNKIDMATISSLAQTSTKKDGKTEYTPITVLPKSPIFEKFLSSIEPKSRNYGAHTSGKTKILVNLSYSYHIESTTPKINELYLLINEIWLKYKCTMIHNRALKVRYEGEDIFITPPILGVIIKYSGNDICRFTYNEKTAELSFQDKNYKIIRKFNNYEESIDLEDVKKLFSTLVYQ
jgi:hypothetical protein